MHGLRWAHLNRPIAGHIKRLAIGLRRPAQVHHHLPDPRILAAQWQGKDFTRTGGELNIALDQYRALLPLPWRERVGERGGSCCTHRTIGSDFQRVRTGSAFHVMQQGGQAAFIPRRKEARQNQLGHQRVAHGHAHFTRAHFFYIEGHRHQTQLTLEIRHIQRDDGLALRISFYHAREQRYGARRHHIQTFAAIRIAALIVAARIQAANQAPVIVAHPHTQLALAQVVRLRSGCFEARKLQNALIDGGQGHIGRLAARCHAGNRHRNVNFLPWRNFARRINRHFQRALSRIQP